MRRGALTEVIRCLRHQVQKYNQFKQEPIWAPDTNKLHQLINVMQNPVARRDSHIKRKGTLVVLPGVRIADVS